VLLSLLASAAATRAAPPASGPGAGRFVQQEFCVSFWYDPPADDRMAESYRQIAEANFNVVLGTHGAHTVEQIRRQLELCERLGLKAIVRALDGKVTDLPDSPACIGYLLDDEPKARDFERLAGMVRAVREQRPGRLAFINLYPSHGNPKHWGVDSYDAYVSGFLQATGIDVLSFDRYPVMNPGIDERDGYCENLDVIRGHAMQAGIPFWNFFNIMPYGRHYDPTEAQVAWQIYTSLAYGARGVLYFCYWTPRGGEFPRGGAIIAADGRPTRHYDQVRRINARLRHLGPALMQLQSTAVVRIRPADPPGPLLAGTPLRDLSEGDYLVGCFRRGDGRRAVLLNNYRDAYTAWPTVVFDGEAGRFQEVDQQTGGFIPVRDDSPDMPGLQVSLDAGEGRLFVETVRAAGEAGK
jgi:hypothetical protein